MGFLVVAVAVRDGVAVGLIRARYGRATTVITAAPSPAKASGPYPPRAAAAITAPSLSPRVAPSFYRVGAPTPGPARTSAPDP